MIRSVLLSVALLAGAAATMTAHAADYLKVFEEDQPGAKDHPFTGRYGDSKILLQSVTAYDEIVLPSGKASNEGGKHFTETLRAEGKITRTVYITPRDRSSLEVFRNFYDQLANAGFQIVFECAKEECGQPFKELRYHWNNKSTHVSSPEVTGDRARLVQAVFDGAHDIRYALMKKDDNTLAALFVALNRGGSFGDMSTALNERVTALVEIAEPRAMENLMRTVDSNEMATKIASTGSVALYGLYFDTDKAELKAESEPQLNEMVTYLQGNDLKFYVVGHTDSQGSLDYNLDLSNRRAKAVRDALVARGIAGDRLEARGVGPLAPAAPNEDDEGRAKNRRVVLVAR
ncbi:OmpA family protein [Chelativorans composti]|uniref:OmpA family protein n=1 Tax=Chelativorans composti TaxID=768533 RepID=A0ABW5DF16_9HYPH